jgi:hypothetical protein
VRTWVSRATAAPRVDSLVFTLISFLSAAINTTAAKDAATLAEICDQIERKSVRE